ncbi:MAG: hypothetical protein Q8943_18385 [Bacteroidota bacterium]|nr:hypothetical protein [Bacteroidota bacterium]
MNLFITFSPAKPTLQKPLAILFLGLMLSLQYGRTLNYLRCQVMRMASAASVQCDCEKQFTDNPVDKDRSGAEAASLKPRLEEPFTGIDEMAPAYRVVSTQSPGCLPDPSVQTGFASPVFQPPRA